MYCHYFIVWRSIIDQSFNFHKLQNYSHNVFQLRFSPAALFRYSDMLDNINDLTQLEHISIESCRFYVETKLNFQYTGSTFRLVNKKIKS